MVIWKYKIEKPNEIETFMIPRRAKIRHGDYQLVLRDVYAENINLHFWVELDPDAKEMQSVDVLFVGTGDTFTQSMIGTWYHINSFVVRETNEVYHVYCRQTETPTNPPKGR